jgi:hypothetical protein
VQDEVAGLREGVARRLRELEAAIDAKVAALSESTSKNVQLGARVRRLSRVSPGASGA